MEEEYGKENAKCFIELLNKISILIDVKFDKNEEKRILAIKDEIEEKIEKIKDNKKFVEELTKEKRKLTDEIKNIDETINNKAMLQEEYNKRNEKLPLEKKIFSIRILSQLMTNEREEKIVQLEKLNELMNPQKFVEYKKELENQEAYLKLLDTQQLQDDINKLKLELQKIFLKCFRLKIEKARK